MDRRTFLVATGTILSIPFAGCTSRMGGNSNESGEKDGTGEYEIADSSPSLTFDEVAPGEHSLVVHIRSRTETEAAFAYDDLSEDTKREVQTFVDGTDFEENVPFYVETSNMTFSIMCYTMSWYELPYDITLSTQRGDHHECRDCGANVRSETDECPSCGGEIATYNL